jgi:hypothetical protein
MLSQAVPAHLLAELAGSYHVVCLLPKLYWHGLLPCSSSTPAWRTLLLLCPAHDARENAVATI